MAFKKKPVKKEKKVEKKEEAKEEKEIKSPSAEMAKKIQELMRK